MNPLIWRDTGLSPKLFMLDASAIFPLAIFFLHWAWWTFLLSMVSVVILYLVSRTGMNTIACFRTLRHSLVGCRRDTACTEQTFRKRCRW